MKPSEMTLDQLRICGERCDIKLGDSVEVKDGETLFIRSIKGTIWKREARDKGSVMLGKHQFVYFPKSGTLCRTDFCSWIKSHWHECLTVDGKEKVPEKTAQKIDEQGVVPMWKDVKKLVRCMPKPTGLLKEANYNKLYELREDITRYTQEVVRDKLRGEKWTVSLMQTVFLSAVYEYRRNNKAKAIKRFKELAGLAIKSALFIQEENTTKSD